MKVLLDTCVWGGAVRDLQNAGHDVVWTGDWAEDPGDYEILVHAHQEGRVLVTLDKDFGELAIVHGTPHSGIIRIVAFSARQQGTICADLLDRFKDELSKGAIVTAERGRVRVRPAERADETSTSTETPASPPPANSDGDEQTPEAE